MVPSLPSASSLASAGDAPIQRPSESSTPVDEVPSTGDYSKVTLIGVEVHSREIENDGEVVDEDYVTIRGRNGATFKSKEIRTMCKLLGVSVYKSRSKAVMLDLITQKKVNNSACALLFQKKKLGRSDPLRKQPQCPFRLLNIVFSDAFAARLDHLGDKRTRSELDSGVSVQQRFWEDVHRAFVSAFVEAYGTLAFKDKHIAIGRSSIDPSIIVLHDWESLKPTWNKLLHDYEVPSTKFAASGTHSSDFFKFCNGRVDLLYLRLYLEERPGPSLLPLSANFRPKCFTTAHFPLKHARIRLHHHQNVSV
ncbi:hypothetical protein PF005_g9965 [Phytophthora fragariae]|uniref:Uncharacterized protein n=1 Tax=Phytophthora fragariae TaxID=53985 RepID=A0A6A4EEZ7_9STRA|nr:hypothetical protein PF003_g6330 [Phytophthora fragariae]KAE8942981.1 hypothetical protein PF009_g7274 [Phytophthora fragariae]KAE9126484.1 hypothetical protein PF007_g5969 [Phytophthora fragariae]KAE9151255.1 hypothetical protein PF006_g4435 [Phytophthora fragariae]KAE9214077.1 hypothetical protein PF005_g9965 [Phytophthora fragariae]